MLRIAPDRALVLTTDFFPPVVDDPYAFGQIAAANALSDVYAMGGKILAALNLLSVPPAIDMHIVGRILAGGESKVEEAGGSIAGGHSVEEKIEIRYGLAVTGEVHPDRIIRNRGLRDGDALILTKPLGTGLITSSIKTQRNDGPEVAEAIKWMSTLNGCDLDLILAAEPHAMTDVTGFGFLGHLGEMLAQDPLEVVIRYSQLPLIPGVEKCFHKACKTRGAVTNEAYVGERLSWHDSLGPWERELLLDPQTSGGLLFAIPKSAAAGVVEALRSSQMSYAAVVGEVSAAELPRLRVEP